MFSLQSHEALQQDREGIEQIVSTLIDEYWEWFNTQCRAVGAANQRGEKIVLGRIAPVMERKKSGDNIKTYVKWKDFGGQKIRKVIPSASKDIAKAATEDFQDSIIKRASWETPKALELEAQLIPLRLQLYAIHEAQIRLKWVDRKLQRISNKKAV